MERQLHYVKPYARISSAVVLSILAVYCVRRGFALGSTSSSHFNRALLVLHLS